MKIQIIATLAFFYVVYRLYHAEMVHVLLSLHPNPKVTKPDAALGLLMTLLESLPMESIDRTAKSLFKTSPSSEIQRLRDLYEEISQQSNALLMPKVEQDCELGITCSLFNRTIPGRTVPIRTLFVRPSNCTSQRVVIYFHGGGMVLGTAWTSPFGFFLASQLDALLISVEYRLAPEFPYPLALHDGVDVLTWVVTNAKGLGIDVNQIVLAGESAGGLMSASVAQYWKDHHASPQIETLVLMMPMLSPVISRSYATFADIHLLPMRMMGFFWDMYVPSVYDCVMDRYCAPPSATVEQMVGIAKRAFVVTCNSDVLMDEGVMYAEKLDRAKVQVKLLKVDGAHVSGLIFNADDIVRFLNPQAAVPPEI